MSYKVSINYYWIICLGKLNITHSNINLNENTSLIIDVSLDILPTSQVAENSKKVYFDDKS